MKAVLLAAVASCKYNSCPSCLYENYDLKVWCKTKNTCLDQSKASTCAGNLLRTLLECQTVYPNLKKQTYIVTNPNEFRI